MNRYAVEWLPDAESELADIWITATDRDAVTGAEVNRTRILANDPINNGAPLSEGLRKLELWPLVVFYSVDSTRNFVEVSNVKRLPP
jgi:hypothetical protein